MKKISQNSPIDYSVRRGAISTYGRALKSARFIRWCVAGLTLIGLIALGLLLISNVSFVTPVLLLGWVVAVLVVAVGLPGIWFLVYRHFIQPELALRKWLQQVCDGNLDARIILPESHPHHKELNFHTRNLAASLLQLSTEMEDVVESQTHSLEQQKKVRGLLFRIAADVARESDTRELIDIVCQRLAAWWETAVVYGCLKVDGHFTIVTALQSTKDGVSTISVNSTEEQLLELSPQTISITDNSNPSHPAKIQVPFFTGNVLAGYVQILCDPASSMGQNETERVLETVSEQLSQFMTKQQAAKQAQGARIISERTSLAAAIHDSLAQTLLATRNQVALLKESMSAADNNDWYAEVEKIERTINVANREVREMIHEYRMPISEQRHIDVLEQAIEEFRESSNMDVFFQCGSPSIRFAPEEISVVKKIVGESLMNAQKYSKAELIRVYLDEDHNGVRSILVEDDGIGFSPDLSSVWQANGSAYLEEEHFGMSIMHERALSIGAVLNIESEPSEGTRVSLKLPPIIGS
ncbi:MAG: hypothetical protein KTR35_19880 [Gammaproteobacteria bacterium]|nr:hypothetical protein [Gammaproteobacteria bacterium]